MAGGVHSNFRSVNQTVVVWPSWNLNNQKHTYFILGLSHNCEKIKVTIRILALNIYFKKSPIPIFLLININTTIASVVKIPGSPDSPAFQVEAILDPVSATAQKLAPILLALRQLHNLDIRIFMNSKDKLSEMPLKRWLFCSGSI